MRDWLEGGVTAHGDLSAVFPILRRKGPQAAGDRNEASASEVQNGPNDATQTKENESKRDG